MNTPAAAVPIGTAPPAQISEEERRLFMYATDPYYCQRADCRHHAMVHSSGTLGTGCTSCDCRAYKHTKREAISETARDLINEMRSASRAELRFDVKPTEVRDARRGLEMFIASLESELTTARSTISARDEELAKWRSVGDLLGNLKFKIVGGRHAEIRIDELDELRRRFENAARTPTTTGNTE